MNGLRQGIIRAARKVLGPLLLLLEALFKKLMGALSSAIKFENAILTILLVLAAILLASWIIQGFRKGRTMVQQRVPLFLVTSIATFSIMAVSMEESYWADEFGSEEFLVECGKSYSQNKCVCRNDAINQIEDEEVRPLLRECFAKYTTPAVRQCLLKGYRRLGDREKRSTFQESIKPINLAY